MNRPNRREILAFLAALPTALAASRPARAQLNAPKIVIIGAGLAGLAAAEALIRRGADVTVLEARDRMGGRLVTDTKTFEGVKVDLGGSWLTGSTANPLLGRLEQVGAQTQADTDDTLIFMNAQQQNAAAVRRFDELYHNIEAAVNGLASRNLTLEKLRPRDEDELLALTLFGPFQYGVEIADLDPADIAALTPKQDNLFVKSGMGLAVQSLFRAIPVTYNSIVTDIEYDETSAKISTRDGQTHTADAVIITASTGVLGSGSIRFSPDLPDEHRQAISNLPMGLVNHIYLQFSGNLFGSSVKELTHLYGVTQDNVLQARLSYTDPSIIQCTVGGTLARQLERQSDASAINYALSSLSSMLGTGVERAYINGSCTRWGRDPFALGSHSAARPGQSAARAVLATPAGVLHFAGEALAGPWATQAAGAYLSGRAAAARIMGLTE